jgi:hypothetical protein
LARVFAQISQKFRALRLRKTAHISSAKAAKEASVGVKIERRRILIPNPNVQWSRDEGFRKATR